jgi:Non-ribosomal peptide synthetase modules and related proteins
MHHIVSDGWSMGVLVKEVAALYEAYLTGQPSPLPELKLQYADFAVWQRDWLRGEVLEEQLSYWRAQLAGAPALLELPTDRPRALMSRPRSDSYSFVIDSEVSAALTQLSQSDGVTLFMTLLAAFGALLQRYTAQSDIVIGTPIANRNHSETEDLIGFFVNTLALRLDLHGDPSFRDLLKRVREVCLGAYTHQDIPFEKLVEELQPERAMSHTPIFQAAFVLQNAPVGELKLPGLSLSVVDTDSGAAKFDLTLYMQELGDVLTGKFWYSAELFETASIARLAAHFQNVLGTIAKNADQPISQLKLMSPDERQRLLKE